MKSAASISSAITDHNEGRLLFNPLFHPIATRQPLRYNVLSGWMGHVPFAMSLVDMAKPRVLAELGTQWGISYFGFCQAVLELGLDTRCFAVDTWEGDAHANFYSDLIFADVNRYNDEHYPSFSTLIRSTFDEARGRFADGSIDLLHIDGYHTYEAVKHDFETWRSTMSDRGIVMFHDTNVRDTETFGVWRFWDEIKDSYPSIEFLHSNGLGVIAVGREIPEVLRDVFGADPARRALIQGFYAGLGERFRSDSAERQKAAEVAAERDALQVRLASLRYKAVDRLAHLVGRVPFLAGAARSSAGALRGFRR